MKRLLIINLFWKFLKTHFSDKKSAISKIPLVENDLILSKYEDIAFVMNDFFSIGVPNLNISQDGDMTVDIDQFEDPVFRANEK